MSGKPLMELKTLGERIREAALLEGDFTLRSGRKSRYYLDKYLFETQPALLRSIAGHFAAKLGDATLVAGAELGGIPLAAATALATELPFVIVRNSKKDYGTSKMVEGRISPADRVVLVEDVVTTGGQAVEAVESIRKSGARVDLVLAVIDRLEGGAEAFRFAKVRFEPLFTVESLGIRQ